MPRSPLITTCFTGFFTAAAASLGGAHCAWAGTVTTSNETALVAYSGAAPTPYFSGSNPYVATGSIGTDFATSTLTVQASAPINGKVDVTFTYLSDFAGTQTVNGVQVAPADIFLSPGSSGQGSPFTYGISLGQQTQNGGMAAGFYQIEADETSQQIWASRPGFIYGGAMAPSTNLQPGQPGFNDTAAPTVITAGRYLGSAAITMANAGQGWYDWNISVVMTANQATLFDQGFGIFWGTADCANGAFYSQLPALPVPEPTSIALLSAGVALLATLKPRRKAA